MKIAGNKFLLSCNCILRMPTINFNFFIKSEKCMTLQENENVGMDSSFSKIGFELVDDIGVKLLTKKFLQRSSRLQILPTCLRSEMTKKSLLYDMEETQELKRRPDACRNCGLILERTSALIMMQRQKNRRGKNKKTSYRKLLRVGCNGCGWKSSAIPLPQSKPSSNGDKDVKYRQPSFIDEPNSTNTSFDISGAFNAAKRTSCAPSLPSPLSAPPPSANKFFSASAKARRNNKVNKLRNMVAMSSSGSMGASLSDFLSSLSK